MEKIFCTVAECDQPKKRKQSTLLGEHHLTFGLDVDFVQKLKEANHEQQQTVPDPECSFSEFSFKNLIVVNNPSLDGQLGSRAENSLSEECGDCTELKFNVVQLFQEGNILQIKNDRLKAKNAEKREKIKQMSETIKSLRQDLDCKNQENEGLTEELSQSQCDLELLMSSAKDVKQMLDDIINVKLRYELIIQNLIENDEKDERQKLPVL